MGTTGWRNAGGRISEWEKGRKGDSPKRGRPEGNVGDSGVVGGGERREGEKGRRGSEAGCLVWLIVI